MENNEDKKQELADFLGRLANDNQRKRKENREKREAFENGWHPVGARQNHQVVESI